MSIISINPRLIFYNRVSPDSKVVQAKPLNLWNILDKTLFEMKKLIKYLEAMNCKPGFGSGQQRTKREMNDVPIVGWCGA